MDIKKSGVTEFNSVEFQNAYPDGINNHYWNKARNYIILGQLSSNDLKNKPVLEIGCGRGGVVAFLKNKGIDIFGIELAPCTPFKNAENDILTGKDALEMDEAFREKYKTILLLDVIEHIENPVAFIKSLLAAYKNIEQILFTVPARSEIWSNYDEYYGHFRRYNLEMSEQVMNEINFNIKDNRYFFHSLYIPAKLLAKNKKDRNLKLNAPQGILSKTINSILAICFRIEYAILPKAWKGTSVLCRAVRSV